MAHVEGLHQRKGSSRYSLRILIPEDLQAFYEGKTHVVKALDTSDKAEAVREGLRLRLQWLEKFDTKRKALNPQELESITPEMAQALAEAGRRGVLQRDQGMRNGEDGAFKALRKGIREQYERQQIPRIRMPNSRGWPTPEELPELVPLGGISEWEAGVVSEVNTSRLEEARKNIARGNLLYFLPALQLDAQTMGLTVTMETEGLKEALQAYTKSYLQALQEAAPSAPARHLRAAHGGTELRTLIEMASQNFPPNFTQRHLACKSDVSRCLQKASPPKYKKIRAPKNHSLTQLDHECQTFHISHLNILHS